MHPAPLQLKERMQYKVHYAPGLTVAALVLAAQLEIAWFLRNDWKNRLSKGVFRALSSFLYTVWFITGAGILVDLFGLQYGTPKVPRFFTLVVAFATIWGFTSAIAVNIYAIVIYAT